MSPEPSPEDRHYAQAAAAVERVLHDLAQCSDAERCQLEQDFVQLQQMTAKLETGRVDIAVFGEISTGKSALINALVRDIKTSVSVCGGWTKEVWSVPWSGCGYVVPGMARSQVVLIDTPGINEVNGQDRAQMAHEAAQRADVIIFVTDSDLNETEFTALRQLAAGNRPIIVVLNKCDLYDAQQRDDLVAALCQSRLPGVEGPGDIVQTIADPRPVEYVIESPDGSTRTQMRKPDPDTEQLKLQILQVLQREGKALLALNAAMFAADKSDKIAATKVRMRDELARKLIWSYVASKAVAVAANPLPVVDVLGGTFVDASMVVALARIYRIQLSPKNASSLINSILKAAGWVTLSEIATHLSVSILKGLTFGVSTLITAPLQGAAAGYGSYIVGQSARYYLEHGASWAGRSPKAVVSDIIRSTDKHSVIQRLKSEIHQKLARNPHARQPDP